MKHKALIATGIFSLSLAVVLVTANPQETEQTTDDNFTLESLEDLGTPAEENVSGDNQANEDSKKADLKTNLLANNVDENLLFNPQYNFFEEESGLFRFQHLNQFRVKKEQGIYYLEELAFNKPVFQIFEKSDEIKFDPERFTCRVYQGANEQFTGKEVCFTDTLPPEILINLELFGEEDLYLRTIAGYFAQRKLLNVSRFNEYARFTRGDTIALVLKLRYTNNDFSEFKDDCFADVSVDHPYAGEICYGKEHGIISGIGEKFYPENSINLWGILKILFTVFEVDSLYYEESYIDEELFAKMKTLHAAYDLMAKGYYEGIYTNLTNSSLWSNQSIDQGEAFAIFYNFLKWRSGLKIRNYEPVEANIKTSEVYFKPEENGLVFEVDTKNFSGKNKIKNRAFELGGNLDVYISKAGNIFSYLMSVEDLTLAELAEINVDFDPQRRKGRVQVIREDGFMKVYDDTFEIKQFEYLKKNFLNNGSQEIITNLQARGLLPNATPELTDSKLPEIKVFLSNYDLKQLFTDRTSNNRYQAYAEIVYPDGTTTPRSVLVKTRGNGTRGYIKSSLTIEAFDDFEEYPEWNGDEFLTKSDEIKLISMIANESMINEQLFYDAFRGLGHVAPEYFSATLEINGINMGLYQATEAVKKNFFERRGIKTEDYYYARLVGSFFDTNLTYREDDQTTLAQYDIHGSAERLLDLIKKLEANDSELLANIAVEEIIDYAALAYSSNAFDSLTQNYYVYFDQTDLKWHIFPWDGDQSYKNIPERVANNQVWNYLRNNEGSYNNLLYYLGNNLTRSRYNRLYRDFTSRYQSLDLANLVETKSQNFREYLIYDNQLWNGKFLERRQVEYDTLKSLNDLRQDLENQNF